MEVGDELHLPVRRPSQADDELPGDLADRVADVLVRGEPLVQVHADELDLHRGEAEVVDVLDPVPERAPLATQRDSRRAEPDHGGTGKGGV